MPTLFRCLLEKQTWMNHTLTLLIFWPRTYPFLRNCNILPSAKWLQCHLPARERQGGGFFLSASPAFQGIPVKKACDSSCEITQALVVFLESSHNQFNVSDMKANVSFCLRHHQQFSNRFGFGSTCLARDSENWVQAASRELLRFYSVSAL